MMALAVVLGAVVIVAAWALAGPLCLGWDRLLRGRRPSVALRLARWNLVVLGAPLVGGLVLAVAVMGGTVWACHCGGSGLHLCFHHPERSAELLLPAALVWLVVVPRVSSELRRWWIARRIDRQLQQIARLAAHEDGVYLAPLGHANAFTLGSRHPLVLADAAWWRGLSPTERAMVRAHEEAHVHRRDPLALGIARLLAALLPPPAHRLVRWWQAGAEHAADRRAAQVVGGTLEVAAFLLRQARTRSVGTAFHGHGTALRIAALAEAAPEADPAGAGPPEGDLDRTLAALGLLVAAGLLFAAELHHLADLLLHRLS